MPETIPQTTTTTTEAPVVQAPTEDLVTRASKVSITPAANQETVGQPSSEASLSFNVKDLEKITDPTARKFAEDAYKSMQSDYTKKTQALASEKAVLKAQLEQSGQYTTSRIQQLLNDPSFVQAAQEYQRLNGPQPQQAPTDANADLTADEFSYLTPEQQKLYTKTKQMEQTMNIMNNRLQTSEIEKQDMSLKTKYANYDPKSVNDIYQGMMNGSIQATREHLWKVQDYDSAVQRAYKLGLEDRASGLAEKVNASSTINGVSVTSSNDVPVRLAKESGVEYFKRIAIHNASKLMKK